MMQQIPIVEAFVSPAARADRSPPLAPWLCCFTCKSSTWESDEWGDLTKSTLKAGGVAYDTCDAMKDYAASQRRLLADSSSPYDHLEL